MQHHDSALISAPLVNKQKPITGSDATVSKTQQKVTATPSTISEPSKTDEESAMISCLNRSTSSVPRNTIQQAAFTPLESLLHSLIHHPPNCLGSLLHTAAHLVGGQRWALQWLILGGKVQMCKARCRRLQRRTGLHKVIRVSR